MCGLVWGMHCRLVDDSCRARANGSVWWCAYCGGVRSGTPVWPVNALLVSLCSVELCASVVHVVVSVHVCVPTRLVCCPSRFCRQLRYWRSAVGSSR